MSTATETRSVLSVRKIVVSGVLSAIVILLGITRVGFIPVPTPVGNATIMHVPVILGAILEGPIVGLILGTLFGIFSFVQATVPAFKDPWVAIFPRMFIGITAYFSYVALKNVNEILALLVAATVGTLTNTILVLGMAVRLHYIALPVAVSVGIVNGVPEVVVACIVVLAVMIPWKRLETGSGKSKL